MSRAKRNGTARAELEVVAGRQRKTTLTAYIREDVAEITRDAVDALSGPPHRMTLGRFVEEALLAHLERLRRSALLTSWPKRPSGQSLRRGRPRKVAGS